MDEKDLEDIKEKSLRILQKEESERSKGSSLNNEALRKLEGSEKSAKSHCSKIR